MLLAQQINNFSIFMLLMCSQQLAVGLDSKTNQNPPTVSYSMFLKYYISHFKL